MARCWAIGATGAAVLALLVIAAVEGPLAWLQFTLPTLRDGLGLMFPVPIDSWDSTGIPLLLVVAAAASGALQASRTSESLVAPAITGTAIVGLVMSVWVFLLAVGLLSLQSGPSTDVGVALEKAGIFAGSFLVVSVFPLVPLALAWAWVVRFVERHLEAASRSP